MTGATRTGPLTLLVAGCLVGPALAQPAESDLPAPVRAEIAASRKACEPAKARLEAGFLSVRDVNRDGRPDYILDFTHFYCGETQGFCGSGGCTSIVFVSAGTTLRKVLDDTVQAVRFRQLQGRPAMLVTLAGSACGLANAQSCKPRRVFLDEPPAGR